MSGRPLEADACLSSVVYGVFRKRRVEERGFSGQKREHGRHLVDGYLAARTCFVGFEIELVQTIRQYASRELECTACIAADLNVGIQKIG